jgi:hypothetical protein
MEQIDYILGYQYNPENLYFIGSYTFPNNLDKEEIHLPPFTTLTPPPENIPNGFRAYWREGEWSVEVDVSNLNKIDFQEIHINELYPKFIEDCKKYGIYDLLMDFYAQNPQLTNPATAPQHAEPGERVLPEV